MTNINGTSFPRDRRQVRSLALAMVDTGPLVAIATRNDPFNIRCKLLFQRQDLHFIVPVFVVSEAAYLIGKRLGPAAESTFLLAVVNMDIEMPASQDWTRIAALIDAYHDFPIGAVDASVISTAERLGISAIMTLDRRHFQAVRPSCDGPVPPGLQKISLQLPHRLPFGSRLLDIRHLADFRHRHVPPAFVVRHAFQPVVANVDDDRPVDAAGRFERGGEVVPGVAGDNVGTKTLGVRGQIYRQGFRVVTRAIPRQDAVLREDVAGTKTILAEGAAEGADALKAVVVEEDDG